MGYIEGKIEKEQYSFLPICFDELIENDNPVRMINAFVESLNMEKIGFTKSTPKVKGRPGYSPKTMLKLYLYGYFNGIRSSRKLAKESKRNIELFWLLTKLQPDFRTISDFRKENIDCMKSVFGEFSNLCNKLNLIGKEIVAIDGSKFRASNSRKKNYTKGKLAKQIEYYEDNVDKYMELLDEMDEQEEEEEKLNISKEELKKKIEEAKARIEELKEIKDKVEKEGEISLTDPDAKHMQTNNNGTDICHNVQIAVDNKNDLVVAVDVTSSPADQTQLHNMSIKAKEEMGVEEIITLADKGYWNGEELKKCKENGIITVVAAPKETGNKGYRHSDFKYNKEKDYYVCPKGNILSLSSQKSEYYTNTKACRECPNRELCTKSSRGKRVTLNKNDEILKENRERQLNNMELYKTRQMIVEHVFGTVKRALGFTHLLLKGNPKVKGESFMHFLIYNMKRVLNIMEFEELIEAING